MLPGYHLLWNNQFTQEITGIDAITVRTYSALIPQGFNISPPVVNLSNLFSSAEGKICKVMLAGPRIFPCP